MFLLLAILVGALGSIPLLVSTFFHGESDYEDNRTAKLVAAAVVFVAGSGIFWWIFYCYPPALYEPWWGEIGVCIWMAWIVCAIIAGIAEETFPRTAALPILMMFIWLGSLVFRGSEMMNAAQYGQLIGTVEKRVWTQDIQPKSPEHVRTNSVDNAHYMAQQALGQAGAIGSQFKIVDPITLQKVGDKFWYIVPLDHQGWSTWRHVRKVPAYIRVSGEDPSIPAELVNFTEGQEPVYTPESCWEYNLERHLWTNGYASTGLMDFTPEVDEKGKFWYVVTIFEYVVNGWDGKRVTGVLIVDPVTGQITRQAVGSIDKWADRVIPAEIVQQNLGYKGMYPEGDYWNTVELFGIGARKNLTAPETSNMVYGSDGELYWVTGVTAVSKDTSLVGLYYTNTHTGKTVYYETQGSTDKAILAAIDKHQDVQFRHLHGVAPQIYNIAGVMTAIVPMLNDNHAYQGVGFVNVRNLQVMSFGSNQTEAYEKYQAALSQSGHQIAPELARSRSRLDGTVDRFFAETQNGSVLFYLHLQGTPHIFMGTSTLSPKLRLTHVGDHVAISYVASGADVEPLREFDNLSLPLKSTVAQATVREQGRANVQSVENKTEAGTLRESLRNLPDEELVKRFQAEKK